MSRGLVRRLQLLFALFDAGTRFRERAAWKVVSRQWETTIVTAVRVSDNPATRYS